MSLSDSPSRVEFWRILIGYIASPAWIDITQILISATAHFLKVKSTPKKIFLL